MKSLRFVIAVPVRHPGSLRTIQAAARPDQVCGQDLRLWTHGDVPVIDLGDAGYIIGVLFSSTSTIPFGSLPPGAPVNNGSEALAAWLVHECWGAYVALLSDRTTGSLEVMVDPSGLYPAYLCRTPTHVILASHPELVHSASGARLAVSWQNLRAHLNRTELRQRSTCLVGITELPPGALVQVDDPSAQEKRIWRPNDFMPGSIKISFEEARSELRTRAIQVLSAWSNVLGPVTVAASGGVDSSFICAALKAGGQHFTCVTVSTDDPSGDERAFAHLLGDHLGVQTISALFDYDAVDPLIGASVGLTRPTRKAFMAALDGALLNASRSVNANVVLDGNGGDNLFCFLHSSAPVVDRLRCEGPGRDAFSTFMDMCRVTGCDMPTMARAMVKRLTRGSDFPNWPADLSLLANSPDDTVPLDPLASWFSTEVGRHHGKRDHLTLIMKAQHHVHGLGSCDLPRFSPLMSQPLVEICLAIPTWIWCEGGINRALARAAFAAELPREILTRTSKSGPDSFIRRSFDQHRLAIRDLLMDGLLAQHGIIDRSAVNDALTTDAVSGGSIVYRLLDLAEAESWARSWEH